MMARNQNRAPGSSAGRQAGQAWTVSELGGIAASQRLVPPTSRSGIGRCRRGDSTVTPHPSRVVRDNASSAAADRFRCGDAIEGIVHQAASYDPWQWVQGR